MNNQEFLALIEKIDPDPMSSQEEQALIDESFDEDLQKFLDGDDFEEEEEDE